VNYLITRILRAGYGLFPNMKDDPPERMDIKITLRHFLTEVKSKTVK